MIIDLSVTVNEATPVYPGDPQVVIQPAGIFASDGFNDHLVSLGTHVGTHIDAPLHMIEGGSSLNQIPIDQFVGRGRCFDVTDGNFEVIKTADIQAGDIVLLRTDMSDKYSETSYFEDYPAMPESIAEYLVDAKVKMVGVDTCSVDNLDGFPNHKILLAGNVLIIENLTNLKQLAGQAFTVYALPIKLEVDGAPARVVAEV